MRPHLHSLVRWPFRPGSPFPWNENSETSNQPRAVEQLCLLTSAQKRPCSKSRRSTGYAPTPSRPSRNPSRDRTLKGWLLIALFGTLGGLAANSPRLSVRFHHRPVRGFNR